MGKGERVSVCERERLRYSAKKKVYKRIKRESDKRRGTEFTF